MSGILQTFNNISYTKEKLDNGSTKLTIGIANERFESIKAEVFKRLAPSVKIQGFRPGKAPEHLVAAHLGPRLFEETLSELVPQCTLEVIKREDLVPLDQIAYQIEKVAEGGGVKYTATFTVFPEFKLPSLKKIRVLRKEVKVKTEEVEKVLKQMFDEQKKKDKSKKQVKFDDTWASSLNMGVKSLVQLKEKVKGELKKQKEAIEQNRIISEVLKQLAKRSKFEVPSVLINRELERREKEYSTRIENLGMKVDDFLRNQKTSIEELKSGWRKEAEENLKSEIMLMHFAKERDIKVDEKELDDQIDSIKDEKLKAQYQNKNGRGYLRSILLNKKIIKKLLEEVNQK